MTTVAIGERMDRDQAMMKSDRDLVGWKGLVFVPIVGVAQKSAECLADLVIRYANVLFGGSVDASPFPCLVEHSAVEFPEIGFGQRILSAKIPRAVRPVVGNKNVRSLEPMVANIALRRVRIVPVKNGDVLRRRV
jgi:hypothetical protein